MWCGWKWRKGSERYLKMENKIRALRAGVVYSVAGVAGQRVEQDAALLVLA